MGETTCKNTAKHALGIVRRVVGDRAKIPTKESSAWRTQRRIIRDSSPGIPLSRWGEVRHGREINWGRRYVYDRNISSLPGWPVQEQGMRRKCSKAEVEVEVDDSARQSAKWPRKKKGPGTSLPNSGAGRGGARVRPFLSLNIPARHDVHINRPTLTRASGGCDARWLFCVSLSEESKTTTYTLVCVMISLSIVMITAILNSSAISTGHVGLRATLEGYCYSYIG